MTVTAPPRPPRPSDPVDREEIEALVEALIEEARQRAAAARRRRGAVAALVALVGVALFAVLGRSAQSQTRPRALGTVQPRRAAQLEDRLHARCGRRSAPVGIYVVNPDGSGKRSGRDGGSRQPFLVARRSEDRLPDGSGPASTW